MVDGIGNGKARRYMLSSKVYALSGKKAAYIRQKGMSTIQEMGMIESHIDEFGTISRQEVLILCRCEKRHANYLLRKMVDQGRISVIGKGRNTQYKRNGKIAK